MVRTMACIKSVITTSAIFAELTHSVTVPGVEVPRYESVGITTIPDVEMGFSGAGNGIFPIRDPTQETRIAPDGIRSSFRRRNSFRR